MLSPATCVLSIPKSRPMASVADAAIEADCMYANNLRQSTNPSNLARWACHLDFVTISGTYDSSTAENGSPYEITPWRFSVHWHRRRHHEQMVQRIDFPGIQATCAWIPAHRTDDAGGASAGSTSLSKSTLIATAMTL
jgi:hypothetical protein